MVLLLAAMAPLGAGCIHFFVSAGVKRFRFPAQVLSASATTAPVESATPPPTALSTEEWLQLPAEPESFIASQFEQEVVRLTNQLRQENNLPALESVGALDEVARGHSQEMARLNYFAHQAPIRDNRRAEDRLAQAGMDYRVLAENIAKEPLVRAYWSDGRVERYTWGEVAQNAVRHWFASIGHRRNMLRRDVEQIGVGAAVDTDNSRTPYLYITQTFRRP